MTTEPGAPASITATARRTDERIVARALDAVGIERSAAAVHDVVRAADEDVESLDGRLSSVADALRALGVRVVRGQGELASALATLGPRRPILCWHRHGPALLTERAGALVQLDEASIEEPQWLSASEVARLSHGGPWFFLAAALPLDEVEPVHAEGGDGDGEHAHPSPRRRLWRWMVAEKHELGTVLVYAVFVGLFTLTLPVATQALVSTVALGTLLQPLVVLTTLLLLALAFSATLRAAQAHVVEIIQRRIFVRVVSDLAHRLPRVPKRALDRSDAPELLNRFFDTFTLQKSAATLLLGGLEITLTILVGMLVLAFYHPMLLAFDVVLVLAVATIVVGFGRQGERTAIAESKRKYAIAAWFEEIARHDSLFRLGGGQDYAALRAEALAREYLTWRNRHFAVVFRQTIGVLAMQAIANAAVLGIGGFLVIERQLSLGQLVAAELIVAVVVTSLAKIGKYLETYYDLLASIDKLGHLSDLPVERADGASCASVGRSGPPALLMADVHAGYGGDADVLRGVSLSIPPGGRVAISGPHGAGKSLLVDLIAALRTPSAGRVLIDGLDLRDVELTSLRAKIGVARSEVISGSILDNVRLGRVNVSPEQVRAALDMVGLLEDVDAMPEGLRTQLTASGEPLSKSQRARLAIARSIAGAPALLVIDDVLDGMEPRVRDPLLAHLVDRDNEWTLVVATNVPEIQRRCDVTHRIREGAISAEGA